MGQGRKFYSEKEAAEILQRAAKLQESAEDNTYQAGISGDELAKIATEAGIDPKFLAAAMTMPESTVSKSFLNLVETYERVYEGELTSEMRDEIIDSIADKYRINRVLLPGKTLRLQITKGTLFGTLELSSRNGRTRLKFQQTPFIAYFGGLHGPLILGVVIGSVLTGMRGPLIGLSVMAAIITLGMIVFNYLLNVGKQKAGVLVDELSHEIEAQLVSEPRKLLESTSAPADSIAPAVQEVTE